MKWKQAERRAREALKRNAAEIDETTRGTPSTPKPKPRRRSRGRRFGAGYGRAS